MTIIQLQAHLYSTLRSHTHTEECIASNAETSGAPCIGVGRAIDHLPVVQVAGYIAKVELGFVNDLYPDATKVLLEYLRRLNTVGARIILCLWRI